MAFERAIKDKEECAQKLSIAPEASVNFTGEDANPPKAKAVQKATEASTSTKEAIEPIINPAFQLYFNLITEEARRPWNKILEDQIDCTSWNDLFELEHAEKAIGPGLPSWTALPFIYSWFSRVMQLRPSDCTLATG